MGSQISSLEKELKNSLCEYEIIKTDKIIKTAKEGAEYFKIKVGQTARTLILNSSNELIYVVVSGRRKTVNLEKLKKMLGVNKLELASKELVKSTGNEIGSVPLINSNYKCIFDNMLMNYDYIYGGTGEKMYTLKIDPQSVLDLNEVILIMDSF